MTETILILRAMVRGAYDLQQVRIQQGLRLCANFRAKLKMPEEEKTETGELSEDAEKVIDTIKKSYKRLTDGVARNRTLPQAEGFTGDELISTFTELVLIDQYIEIERQEAKAFRQMSNVLAQIPVYNAYLSKVVGVGPALAAILVTSFDVHKARHVSSFWKYAGLDVGPDGRGRSKRQEHLVEREYTNAAGAQATCMGVTYNPWLKTKLLGVLAGSFMRQGSAWVKTYNDYKHRLLTDPARVKVTLTQWKKAHAAGEDTTALWAPGRIHKAALRYMIKMFLADFWARWREIEGLPVTVAYHEGKLGHRHVA